MNQRLNELMNLTKNEIMDESIDQLINQSFNKSTNVSINQPINTLLIVNPLLGFNAPDIWWISVQSTRKSTPHPVSHEKAQNKWPHPNQDHGETIYTSQKKKKNYDRPPSKCPPQNMYQACMPPQLETHHGGLRSAGHDSPHQDLKPLILVSWTPVRHASPARPQQLPLIFAHRCHGLPLCRFVALLGRRQRGGNCQANQVSRASGRARCRGG